MDEPPLTVEPLATHHDRASFSCGGAFARPIHSPAGFPGCPAALARRLPHYPVPAAVIGRLAVDLRSQGSGLGEVLLLDAIRRVVRAGDTIGVYAVVVDALHDRAGAFHARYGFAPFPSQPLRLYLPLRTFEQLGL